MKISKLFHWLYFIVMMLPIFTIPIFAIYSHRHQINDYSVNVSEKIVVDFNQLLRNGDFSTQEYWHCYDYSYTNLQYDNGGLTTVISDTSTQTYRYGLVSADVSFEVNNIYYIKFDVRLNGFSSIKLDEIPNSYQTFTDGVLSKYQYRFNYLSSYRAMNVFVEPTYTSDIDINDSYFINNVNVFNLTKMFGSGNEPTIEDFNAWYPNDYYQYNLSQKQLLNTGNYITYNDTDIGSQFTYDVYNVVDKYFNYDNVFNFNQLYDWLNMTFFNGGASLGFFIFWHLLIYWLLTSILWLVFDVLMYVPQLVHRWLDKASIS